MQAAPRVRPAAVVVLLVACPLLSALTLAGLAVGVAALFGDHGALAIGAVIGAVVFVVNAAALCMALTRGDDDARTSAVATAGREVVGAEHARAS
jgi:hypothetical protein